MGQLNDKDMDALLRARMGQGPERRPWLDARVLAAVDERRRAPRGLSLWWMPLALSVAFGLGLVTLSLVVPWQASVLLRWGAWATVGTTAGLTLAGLLWFDLRRKGRVIL